MVNVADKRALAVELLDKIGEHLRGGGHTLDELFESGREIRGELLREMYGIDPDAERDHASSSIAEKDRWHDQ